MKAKSRDLDNIAKKYDSRKDFDRYLIEYGAGDILKGVKKRNVLEIGCASGVMTEILYRKFKRVVVIEPAEKYIDIIRRRYGKKIESRKSYLEIFRPNEKFDNIVMARLLEHLVSPVKALKRVRGWLAPNGFLHVIVPNANSINRLAGRKMGMIRKTTELTPRDIRFGHRRVYDKSLLIKHLKKASLKIVYIKGIYLKPLANAQMIRFNKKMIEAFYERGKLIPAEFCCELYVRCKK